MIAIETTGTVAIAETESVVTGVTEDRLAIEP